MGRPSFAVTDRAFAYLCLAAFAIVALFIANLRRSTTGLALNAVRWSPSGARTLGISVVQMKIIVAGLGALVAGVGGGFLVAAQTTALPGNFDTFLGVVWLAVLVTVGIRSNVAALVRRRLLRPVARARPGLPSAVDGAAPGPCCSGSAPSAWPIPRREPGAGRRDVPPPAARPGYTSVAAAGRRIRDGRR